MIRKLILGFVLVVASGCSERDQFCSEQRAVDYFNAQAHAYYPVQEDAGVSDSQGNRVRTLQYSTGPKQQWRTVKVDERALDSLAKKRPELVRSAVAYQLGFRNGRAQGVVEATNASTPETIEEHEPTIPSPPDSLADALEFWQSGWKRGYELGYGDCQMRTPPYGYDRYFGNAKGHAVQASIGTPSNSGK